MKFCVMPLSGLYRRIFSLQILGASLMLTILSPGKLSAGPENEHGQPPERE